MVVRVVRGCFVATRVATSVTAPTLRVFSSPGRRFLQSSARSSNKRNILGMTTVGSLALAAGVTLCHQQRQSQHAVAEADDQSPPNSTPLFQFGAIADVQYADVDDCYNFSRTQLRKYRATLDVVRRAALDWNTKIDNLDFVVHLGDIIDQQCFGRNESHTCLERVLAAFKLTKKIPFVALIGNHELYNFSRAELEDLLALSPYAKNSAYYSFKPEGTGQQKTPNNWKVVVLDSYAINCIDHIEQDDVKEEAYQILEKNNPNDMRSRGAGNWLQGMSGEAKRFVPYNGSLGETQLNWLKNELEESDKNGEKVILMAHVPIAPGSCTNSCLAWDYKDILKTIEAHECVTAVMTGHDHSGGYAFREGVHYLTFPSPLQATETSPSVHATVQVFQDAIVLECEGVVADTFGGKRITLPHSAPLIVTKPVDSDVAAKL
eukprot:m.128777 g.128777  ORF g.128777 m.128777 type:complete len:434 (-) comp29357_c1_seq1:374-1675(-)